MKQVKFIKLIAIMSCVALSSQSAHASVLHAQLKDIHHMIASLTAEVRSSWTDTDGDEGDDGAVNIENACELKVKGTLSTAIGGTNTVREAHCHANGQIGIKLSDNNINKSLRGGEILLVPVKKTDSTGDGFALAPSVRTGTPRSLLPMDGFVCQFNFGDAVGDGDKQDIQYSQPVGSTIKTNHFQEASTDEANPRKGLSFYCDGIIKGAMSGATPVIDILGAGDGEDEGGDGGPPNEGPPPP
jgi:hypothetical protein